MILPEVRDPRLVTIRPAGERAWDFSGGRPIPPGQWTADLVRTFKSRREFPSPPERL
jgi:hypothetical protein